MSYQRGANPLGLIFVDKPEGDLGLAWFDDVLAAAPDQGRAPVFVRDRDQRDVLDEVDVEEIVGKSILEVENKLTVALLNTDREVRSGRRSHSTKSRK